MMGVAPTAADARRCRTGDILDGRALLLAQAVSGSKAVEWETNEPSLAVAMRRLDGGRLLAALG